MPSAPLPPELERFIDAPRAAVVATVRPDGTPATSATWYVWDDGKLLLNMQEQSMRARNLRRHPCISITILGDSWYDHVSLRGEVVEMREDRDLRLADVMGMRYLGAPRPNRNQQVVTAVVEITHWNTWGDPAKAAATSDTGDSPASRPSPARKDAS